jgi:putative transposase
VDGWQISESLRSDVALDALEMAVWNRTRDGQVLDGLIHHSDRGVQYLSIGYSDAWTRTTSSPQLDRAVTVPMVPWLKHSTASTSGSLSIPRDHGGVSTNVEFATLGYIDRFNHRRLHGEMTEGNSYVTPENSKPTTTVKHN